LDAWKVIVDVPASAIVHFLLAVYLKREYGTTSDELGEEDSPKSSSEIGHRASPSMPQMVVRPLSTHQALVEHVQPGSV
jgi:hypothetical protein